jgi:hypothetical protein
MEEAPYMTSVVYIDVPSWYPYKWELGDDAPKSLSKEMGFNIIFVCNSGAHISNGDVYAVVFKNDAEAVWFGLNNKFELLKNKKVERWIFEHTRSWKTTIQNYFRLNPEYINYLEPKEKEWRLLQA